MPRTYSASALATELNRVINNDGANALVGVYIKSMRSGDILYSRNINHSLIPASTLKLFTAQAALLYLGKEYRFPTQLLTDAKSIQQGTLQGNLYVVLSGDPTLTYSDLVLLFSILKSKGIHTIAGNVYIDQTAYDQSFYGPGWEYKDKNYCWAAPISASIINRNCLSFTVAAAKKSGYAAELLRSPKYFYPAINNTVMTSRAGHCRLHIAPGQNGAIDLGGCIPIGQRSWGVSYVITDLAQYNQNLFISLVRNAGVSVDGATTFRAAHSGLVQMNTHYSKPLKELIREMLKKSDNVIAGALFKKIGQAYTHRSGSWQNGGFAVSEILRKNAGLATHGIRLLDGSGLSPANLTSPAQLMQVLHHGYHNAAIHEDFISALPIAGVDGTLKHRLGNVARRVAAKTGTISGVASLAGYAETANKEPIAFVIMVNGSKGFSWRYKSMEDKVVTLLAKLAR